MKLLPTWAAERLDLLPDEHPGADESADTVAWLTAMRAGPSLDDRPATPYARAVARLSRDRIPTRADLRALDWLYAGHLMPAPTRCYLED